MLEIKNVTKKYGNKVAVNNVSLTVNDGEIFGFIGPNGAGKTTLIKAIACIHDFDEGEIIINNKSLKNNEMLCKKEIAYIPDNPDIYQNLTGIEYLNFVCDIYEVAKEERKNLIEKYAKDFGIFNNLGDLIESYSHGMRQKLVLISAFIHKPKLLILDEPFVGLDPSASKILKDLMKELTKEGGIIFFSSHVLEVVEKLCDKIAIIKDGIIVKSGDMESVIKDKNLETVFLGLANEK